MAAGGKVCALGLLLSAVQRYVHAIGGRLQCETDESITATPSIALTARRSVPAGEDQPQRGKLYRQQPYEIAPQVPRWSAARWRMSASDRGWVRIPLKAPRPHSPLPVADSTPAGDLSRIFSAASGAVLQTASLLRLWSGRLCRRR